MSEYIKGIDDAYKEQANEVERQERQARLNSHAAILGDMARLWADSAHANSGGWGIKEREPMAVKANERWEKIKQGKAAMKGQYAKERAKAVRESQIYKDTQDYKAAVMQLNALDLELKKKDQEIKIQSLTNQTNYNDAVLKQKEQERKLEAIKLELKKATQELLRQQLQFRKDVHEFSKQKHNDLLKQGYYKPRQSKKQLEEYEKLAEQLETWEKQIESGDADETKPIVFPKTQRVDDQWPEEEIKPEQIVNGTIEQIKTNTKKT